jgi:hypothetical protein
MVARFTLALFLPGVKLVLKYFTVEIPFLFFSPFLSTSSTLYFVCHFSCGAFMLSCAVVLEIAVRKMMKKWRKYVTQIISKC